MSPLFSSCSLPCPYIHVSITFHNIIISFLGPRPSCSYNRLENEARKYSYWELHGVQWNLWKRTLWEQSFCPLFGGCLLVGGSSQICKQFIASSRPNTTREHVLKFRSRLLHHVLQFLDIEKLIRSTAVGRTETYLTNVSSIRSWARSSLHVALNEEHLHELRLHTTVFPLFTSVDSSNIQFLHESKVGVVFWSSIIY